VSITICLLATSACAAARLLLASEGPTAAFGRNSIRFPSSEAAGFNCSSGSYIHLSCRRMVPRLPVKFFALTFFSNFGIFINPVMSSPAVHTPHYRADGVRITHNPFAPGMAAKYGAPGATDRDGFDPYADSVGAGIYSGTVKRREVDGSVLIGAHIRATTPGQGRCTAAAATRLSAER